MRDSTDTTAARLERLEQRNDRLERENEAVRERLDALERAVGGEDRTGERDDERAERQLLPSGGQPTKVVGRLSDTDGIGVLGEATGSGATVGVRGHVDSADGYGLETPDDAQVGGQLDMSSSSTVPNIQFSSQGDAYMYMFENGVSNPDQNLISHSADFPDWGLRYDDAADEFVFQSGGEDRVTVNLYEGYVDQTSIGVSAYISSDLSVANQVNQTIVFDTVRNSRDDFDAYDTSTGKFTVPTDGDYHVDFMVDWSDAFSGDQVYYRIMVDSNPRLNADWVEDEEPARSFSKTLFGLSSGEEVYIEVAQLSGSSKTVAGISDGDSYLTIHKVG